MVERHQDFESYVSTNTPLKIMQGGGRHRKVASEFNAKSMMAKQQLLPPPGAASAYNQHQLSMNGGGGQNVHLNSMIEEQLQS